MVMSFSSRTCHLLGVGDDLLFSANYQLMVYLALINQNNANGLTRLRFPYCWGKTHRVINLNANFFHYLSNYWCWCWCSMSMTMTVAMAAPTHPRGEAPLPVIGGACGTCRMGSDPATSVVNLEGRSHEVANLWIVDASVLPFCPSVGVGLTVIANALRIGAALKAAL